MSEDLLAEVRCASERTMSEQTARLRYEWDVSTVGLSAVVDAIAQVNTLAPAMGATRRAWSLVGRAVKAGDSAASRAVTGRSSGTIRFQSGQCSCQPRGFLGARALYFAPGLRLVQARTGGAWRESSAVPIEGSPSFTPMWLIELPRGTESVKLVEEETVGGVSCRHVRGDVDARAAAAASVHGMQLGPWADPQRSGQSDGLGIDAWVDSDGRLRRMRLRLDGASFLLELSDFGTAVAIDEPATYDTAQVKQSPWAVRASTAICDGWAARVAELLPAGEFELSGGATFGMRWHGGSSMAVLPFGLLGLPGTRKQKLERTYRALAEGVQQSVSKSRGAPWPGPNATSHVRVTAEQVEVWWESTDGSAGTVRLRPVPRAELEP